MVNFSVVKPIDIGFNNIGYGKSRPVAAVAGAITHQKFPVVQKPDGGVTIPTIRIVVQGFDMLPGLTLIFGNRRIQRAAPAAITAFFDAVVVPYQEQVSGVGYSYNGSRG